MGFELVMRNGEVTSIVIGVLAVVLLLVRQMRARPVRDQSSLRIGAVIGAIGIVEIVNAVRGHGLGATTVAWLAGMLIVGGALGILRAFTVKIWQAKTAPRYARAPW